MLYGGMRKVDTTSMRSWSGLLHPRMLVGQLVIQSCGSPVQLAEERAANEELEAKLAAYEDIHSELPELQAENERLAKINMAQKEKLEIMQVCQWPLYPVVSV